MERNPGPDTKVHYACPRIMQEEISAFKRRAKRNQDHELFAVGGEVVRSISICCFVVLHDLKIENCDVSVC